MRAFSCETLFLHAPLGTLFYLYAAGMLKRSDSLKDVQAVLAHIPTYVRWRTERESFIHEAVQYALWVPFAVGARYAGWNWLSYLFLTWSILGELLLVYMHQKVVTLRWWQVLAVVVGAGVYFSAELTLPANSFWRFFVIYVIVGIVAFAVCLPLVPVRLLEGAPDFLYTFGFLSRKDNKKHA